MKTLISGLVLLVVGFSMGQMSAHLVQINPWALSLFVAGLGLALGYVASRERRSSNWGRQHPRPGPDHWSARPQSKDEG